MTVVTSEMVTASQYIGWEILFKGLGKQRRTQVQVPPGSAIKIQFQEKGSYRLENVLNYIANLPSRPPGQYAIHSLDDFSAHLDEKVRAALFDKGYIHVVQGGGITPDTQINDTHLHAPLKSAYRKIENALHLQLIVQNPGKIPSSTRPQQALMLWEVWKDIREAIDWDAAFKSLFLTNAIDGSEDGMVSTKLWLLIGEEMVEFRKKLLAVSSTLNSFIVQ